MNPLLTQIKNCRACEQHLASGVNPVITASVKSKIMVIGQAPGRVVHATGIPWNDKSGENLRYWLDVDKVTFYDTALFALIPMGFCYPGTGKSGDLPPRRECAPLWHEKLMQQMPEKKLTLLIGQYAQKYYLKDRCKGTLTKTVKHFEAYLPDYLPLPHPSPRNNIWQAKNPWFKSEVLPVLRDTIAEVLRQK
jgi:uracil-DNA glycosylase